MSKNKTCKKCSLGKPIEDFGNLKSSPDGKMPICKECNRLRGEAYRGKPNRLSPTTVRATTTVAMKPKLRVLEATPVVMAQPLVDLTKGKTNYLSVFGVPVKGIWNGDHFIAEDAKKTVYPLSMLRVPGIDVITESLFKRKKGIR